MESISSTGATIGTFPNQLGDFQNELLQKQVEELTEQLREANATIQSQKQEISKLSEQVDAGNKELAAVSQALQKFAHDLTHHDVFLRSRNEKREQSEQQLQKILAQAEELQLESNA